MVNQYAYEGWRGFREGSWVREIDLRSFIRHNFTMYDGDESFLAGPTQDTLDLWDQVMDLTRQEREAGGVLDMDTHVISTITSHGPGYLNKDKEKIVGFQTDKPFKRAMMPYGGVRMAEKACADNGYTMDPEIKQFFEVHRKTHNAGVFDAYTPEMRACRSSHKLEKVYYTDEMDNIKLECADINRPGMQLAGFYDYFSPDRPPRTPWICGIRSWI